MGRASIFQVEKPIEPRPAFMPPSDKLEKLIGKLSPDEDAALDVAASQHCQTAYILSAREGIVQRDIFAANQAAQMIQQRRKQQRQKVG